MAVARARSGRDLDSDVDVRVAVDEARLGGTELEWGPWLATTTREVRGHRDPAVDGSVGPPEDSEFVGREDQDLVTRNAVQVPGRTDALDAETEQADSLPTTSAVDRESVGAGVRGEDVRTVAKMRRSA